MQVTGAPDDLDSELERAGGPGDELVGVDAVGRVSLIERMARRRFHRSGLAASRSGTHAAVMRTSSSRPRASTAMYRFASQTVAWFPTDGYRLALLVVVIQTAHRNARPRRSRT